MKDKDIVERLRKPAPIDHWHTVLLERKEAADEIERLREALRRIADSDGNRGCAWDASIAGAALGREKP